VAQQRLRDLVEHLWARANYVLHPVEPLSIRLTVAGAF
jgi:hypothetical protein